MKLAASNIGWAPEHLPTMLQRLPAHGVEGLVIAPTMVWAEAPAVSAEQAVDFREQVEDAGLSIVGMQSLTFGLQNAALSGNPEATRRLSDHLKRQAELAGHLGATSLIFGSPGVRKGVDRKQAIATLGAAADVAADHGAKLCIEPLAGYGNEFVTSTVDGVRLVREMQEAGHGKGFGLHLDAAAIAGQSEPRDEGLDIIAAHAFAGIHSFDASAPELGSPSQHASVDHAAMAKALRFMGYTGIVSLEMRAPQTDDPVRAYLNEIDFVREHYIQARRV